MSLCMDPTGTKPKIMPFISSQAKILLLDISFKDASGDLHHTELAGSEPVKCGLTIILCLYTVIGYYNYTN